MKKFIDNPMKSFRNLGHRGFTIAETMVAMGILAVIIVGLLSQQKLSVKETVVVASENEMNNLVKRVSAEVGLQSVCTMNFAGLIPPAANSFITVAAIKRDIPAAPITTANSIVEVASLPQPRIYGTGQGRVLISRIALQKVSEFEMKLVFDYYRKDASEVADLTTPSLLDKFLKRFSSREIPLNITLDGAGRILNCYGNYDQIVKTAIELSCQGNGAFYNPNINPPYGGCQHKVTAITCPAGQYLRQVYEANVVGGTTFKCEGMTQSCEIAGQFVKGIKTNVTVGDADDGKLNCDNAYPTCAAGQVLVSLNSGAVVCRGISCAANSAFEKFDPNTGNAICRPIPGNRTCSPGSYATQVSDDGTTTCATAYVTAGTCPAGQMVQGINPDGSVYCSQFMQLPASCPSGQAIYGFDANGYRMCKTIRRPLSCYGYANNHSYYDCAVAGGSIRNAEQVSSMCAFGGGSCPAGWTRCNSEGQQTSNYCVDVTNTGYCAPHVAQRWAYAPGGDWAWVASGQPGNTCYTFYGYPGTGHNCYQNAYTNVYTTQQTVGCY